MNWFGWIAKHTFLTIKIQIDCLFWKRVLFLSLWVWVISNKYWHLPNNGNMNFIYWSIFCHVPSKLRYSDNDCMINFIYWKKVVTKHLLRRKYVDHSHVRGTPKSFTYFAFLFIIIKNIFGKMVEVGITGLSFKYFVEYMHYTCAISKMISSPRRSLFNGNCGLAWVKKMTTLVCFRDIPEYESYL